MPAPSRPSPSTVTLAVDVPDYRALACAFAAEGAIPLTYAEARALADLRIEVPFDATKAVVEIAVQGGVASALKSRFILAKLIAGGVGEVHVMDYGKRCSVRLGEFAPVETATGAGRAA